MHDKDREKAGEGSATSKLIKDPTIYEDICKKTNDLIQCVDKKGRFVYVNNKWMQTLGYSAVEIAKLKFNDILHPGHRRKYNQLFKRVCRGETIEDIETIFLNNKGEPIVVHGSVKLRMMDGGFFTAIGIFSDITLQKMGEETLMKSKEKYRLISENTSDLIAVLDTKGNHVYVSPSYSQLGYEPTELIGTSGLELIHPDDKKALLPLMLRYARTKIKELFKLKMKRVTEHINFRIPDKSGKWHFFESTANLIENIDGKGYNFLLISHDVTGRKLVEEALQESEQRFKAIFDHSNDGILLADMEKKRFFIGNKTICQMLGYSPDEIKDLGVTDIHPPEDLPHVVDQFEKQAKKEIDVAKDLPVKRKDGSIFYADVSAFPITLAGKSYLVGAFRDTSERKRTEAVLRESEERFRILFEQAADCIFILEIIPQGIPVIRDANNASMKLLGYERGELIGRPISFIDAASDAIKVVDERRVKVLSGSGMLVFEARHRCKDGTVRNFECSVKEMQIGTKTISISVERDITERKRTEAALKESEERYRELVEKAGIAILVDDIEGNFRYYNNKFAELFGYDYSEMAGMSIQHIIHPDDLSRVTKFHQARMQRRDIPATYEFKGIRKGNAPFLLEVSVLPLTQDDQIIGTRSYFWDVSSRKRIEEELRLQSLHDPLTGLFNRRGFLALARQQQSVANRTGKGFFIVYADIDKMKSINDVHGHAVGDQALKAITEILAESFRKSDIIGRLGGDEFAVCAIEALPDSSQIMMNRIKNNLDGYNKLHRLKVSLSLSIGTAYYDPKQPCLIEDLLERADQMMYRQKTHKDGTGLQLVAAPLVFDLQQHKTEFNVKSDLTRVLVVPATSESMISLQSALAVDPGLPIELVIAQDLEHGFNLIDNQLINIVLLETKIQTDAGIDVLRQVQKRCPELPVIVLVDTDDEVLSAQAVREGAQDCLNKTRLDAGLLIRSIRYAIERSRTVLELKNSFSKFLMVFEDTVDTMASIVEVRDPCTAGHQKRVSQLAQTIAQEMNLSDEQRRGIRMAALIHDVGKTKVPEKILNKTGTLNKHEMDLIKTHPSAGYEILKAIKFPWLVTEIVHQHHERMDGSGYPEGIAGNAILIESKILAVADVVEAMCADRSYRTAPGLEKALDEIVSKKNTLYDMQVVDACVNVFKEKKFKFD